MGRFLASVRVILEAARKEKEEKFWAEAEVGKKYQGTVKSLTSFGAFVDIGGVDGLVHISELSWNKIKHPSEVVKEGKLQGFKIKMNTINNGEETVTVSYNKSKSTNFPFIQKGISNTKTK